MLAAGVAGCSATGLFNWMETFKSRMQASTQPLRLLPLIRAEGLFKGLWGVGLGPSALSMGLASSLRMGLYERTRDGLQARAAPPFGELPHEKSASSVALAGLVTGLVAYPLATPFFSLKTNLQSRHGVICPSTGLYTTGNAVGSPPVLNPYTLSPARILRAAAATFRPQAVLPFTIRGAMFNTGHLWGYDTAKSALTAGGLPDSPLVHLLSGGLAALSASLLACPADVVCTLFMSGASPTLGGAVRLVHQRHGPAGYWRGAGVLFTRLCPGLVTHSVIYEQLRCCMGLGYLK
jgi:hypothetical protein